ncbi:MAG: malonyl CoA-ACP transacylase [Gammaproteobacteria bacterium]|nr:malonyl CoA-ACP transacylase [Gammaproteobacteria bacterium]
MSFGFVFPGQGSQSVGMLAKLGAAETAGTSAAAVIRTTFEEASAVLGYDLWQLVQAGPEDQLNSTERTQPAMLVAGVATWRFWRASGGSLPVVVSGHSLGEFTALVCAEALEFGAAVDLVRFRGQAMQEAVPLGTGAVAAILGLDQAKLDEACREAAQGAVVEAVNFNAPGQVVIAGHSEAVQRAIEAAKTRGAKRAVLLPVSVPVHSSLMRGAAERLAARLKDVEIRAPRIRFVSAVDAEAHERPADIRELLVRQLPSPVRWEDTVRALSATAIAQLIECGPGKVLTGLNRRIEKRPGLEFLALEDPASVEAALAATVGVVNA